MKFAIVLILLLVALTCLLFSFLAGADAEGRGGSMALAGLLGFVVALVGAITTAVKF